MKKIHLIFSLFTVLFFAACNKNDGPIGKEIQVERVPAPKIVKDASSSISIDVINPASFSGKLNISLYFPNDVPPQKFDIVVRKNNNNGNVKLLQADLKAFPATLTVTVAQLEALFGAPVVLGDNYDIGADVYSQSGKKYEAFPVVGNGYAAAFQPDHPGFSPQVRFSALCAYNPDIYSGTFVVEEDAWDDLQPGDLVTITKIDANHFSFTYPTAINPLPIIVTVNPDNTAVITKQNIGTVWAYGAIYTLPNAAATGFVSPCEQRVTLNMQWGYSAGTFTGGPYELRMKKQ